MDYEEPDYGSPLYLSLLSCLDEIATLLIEKGAAVLQGEREHSLLAAAVKHCKLDTVLSLFEHGAKIAEHEYEQLPSRIIQPGRMSILELALRRDVTRLHALLPHAERQMVPVEYYTAAHLFSRNDDRLRAAIANVDSEYSMISISVRMINRGSCKIFQV